ncbi:MAG: GAF domain-containing protein, partial [Gemmatimonadetes bacterium]|nr:GAF domain-containing protein [Gemmatimonadota bacterium]
MIERIEDVMRRLASEAPLDRTARADLSSTLALARQEVRELAARERVYRDVIRDRNHDFEEKVLELSILKEIGDVAAASFGRPDLLDRFLEVLGRDLGGTSCSVMRLDPESGELKVVAGRTVGGQTMRDEPARPELHLGEGVAGWVASSREALLVPDISRDVRFKHAGGESPVGSLLCVPLLAGDRVLGVVNLSSRSVGHFDASHVRVLKLVAGQFASAIQGQDAADELRGLSDRLDHEVRERTIELERRTDDLRRKNETITSLLYSLEEAQRELESRNREVVRALAFNDNIVETVNVGIGVIDPEGRIVTWNRAMEDITAGQLAKADMLGRAVSDVPAGPREMFGLGRDLADVAARGRPVTRYGIAVDLPRGESRHLNLHLLPVAVAGDGTGHVILVVENVTSNVALLDERVRAERLAAITATMVSVNHEVNNPLAVILGYAQILITQIQSGASPDRVHARLAKDLAMIESEALRIREITARLAALVEPVVTSYPVSDGQPMVDLAASRSAEIPTHAGDRVSRIIPRPRSLNDPRPAR